MDLKPTPLLLCVLYLCIVIVRTASDENDIEHALRIFDHLKGTRKGLASLRTILNDIDSDLQNSQKRTCAMGGGMSQHCAAAQLDSQMNVHDWLTSGLSPGKKRSAPHSVREANWASNLDDLVRKRKGIDLLRRILDEMEADLIFEQKRTCALNLGGHCATESAAAVADQWHYLNSPLSPGRKRRDTSLFKKLVNGDILRQ